MILDKDHEVYEFLNSPDGSFAISFGAKANLSDLNLITIEDVYEAFRLLNIDSLGLDELERNYLNILQQNGPTPLNVISSKLALPTQTIKTVLEQYLLQENLIEKTKCSHRAITSVAEQHIRNCNA